MGRAQVVQARAARIEPHVDMNPVLLKPAGSSGCQVIVDGKVSGYHKPGSYYRAVDDYRRAAYEAFGRLRNQYELIILEGAGSAAEINLKDGDIANMSMAEEADANVILVADIELGGVFASIYGTIKLLPGKYVSLIKGIVINKFRGDKSLLASGITELERLTDIPVLGVIPYIDNLGIEEEDSASLMSQSSNTNALIDIAVIRLPYISNFTDFQSLEQIPTVNIRYVSKLEDLGNPDLIILPGSKNVIYDTGFLVDSGLDRCIKAAPARGISVMGICGGFQILGETIEDPYGLEGSEPFARGLGLLPVNTRLEKEKELSQVTARNLALPFLKTGDLIKGYEIHMGITDPADKEQSPLLEITEKLGNICSENVGYISDNKLVFGSYLHGIFDDRTVAEELAVWLGIRKGLNRDLIIPSAPTDPDLPFDRLADVVEENIDIEQISKWIQ